MPDTPASDPANTDSAERDWQAEHIARAKRLEKMRRADPYYGDPRVDVITPLIPTDRPGCTP